jgi:hypothetical protein
MTDLQLTLPAGIQHTTRGVSFPLQMARDGWIEYGRFLSRAKDGLTFWRASWLDFGRVNFGDEFVRESIAQLEFEFSEVRKSQLLNSLPVRDPELSAEHHFVLAKAHLDDTALNMWVELKKRNDLTANELQESIKLGRVTKADNQPDPKSWGSGFATVQGIARQWELLMKQIGDLWEEWSASEIAEFRTEIGNIVEFDRKLQKLALTKSSKATD